MKPKTYLDYLPEDGNFTEEDLWEAIALAEGVDYDLSDGDQQTISDSLMRGRESSQPLITS